VFIYFAGKKGASWQMQVRSKLLREARKSAERGYRLIEAQTRIIISLKAAGVDTTDAENTLEAFVKAQDCRLAEIDELLQSMGRVGFRSS
jgi:hypothetical protein